MSKLIILLLFTFFFSFNLFAESNDIYKEISDIKLQIQEIKLLDSKDNKEKKLEKIEKKIDDIEDKVNQNNVDKKELDGKLERNEAVVDNLNTFLTVYGVLITILLFCVSYISYKFTSNEAKQMVNNWIEENKNKILEPVIKEGDKLLRNIKKEADLLLQDYQSSMKNHDLGKALDSKEKDILEKVNILLESKETENYTFDDWYSKFLNYFYKDDFIKALEMINKAFKKAINDKEISIVLFQKALILGRINGKSNEAISIYDKLIQKFKNSDDSEILKRVKLSLVNKIELKIILNENNSEEDVNLYLNLTKDNKEELLTLKMLHIFENAKSKNQDKELDALKIEFSNVRTDWDFYELDNWANNISSEEIKNRILEYINFFKNHNN